MLCSKCSYAMDSFDVICPRCKGQGVAQVTQPTRQAATIAAPAAAAAPGMSMIVKVALGITAGCVVLPIILVALLTIIGLVVLGKQTPVKNTFETPVEQIR